MSPRSRTVPAYCHDKAPGRAIVRIEGRDYYLGPFGSPESHEAYERRIAEWRPSRIVNTAASQVRITGDPFPLVVDEAILRYKTFAESYYVKNGKLSKEIVDIKYSLRPVRQLYGRLPLREFGPLVLKAVRQR